MVFVLLLVFIIYLVSLLMIIFLMMSEVKFFRIFVMKWLFDFILILFLNLFLRKNVLFIDKYVKNGILFYFFGIIIFFCNYMYILLKFGFF